MDTTIIEHLACLEINNIILQPPFHLLSNIKWNDKGLSFNGDIEVYSNNIQKSDFIGRAPVQIKGTTIHKKQYKVNKIKHPVSKKDLEVYYKDGNGVLYFVVTIDPKSYVKKIYYRILAPLDLKELLDRLEANGHDSVTIPFKKLENNKLESICKSFIQTVKKQPIRDIEASNKMKFTNYTINFSDITEDWFDIFEEPVYLYGVLEDLEIPIEIATIVDVRKSSSEVVTINHEQINVEYEFVETKDTVTLIMENSLICKFNKKKKTGSIGFSRLKTLGSTVKCLKLVKYQQENNKFPLKFLEPVFIFGGKRLLKNVDEEIKLHEFLIEACNHIGLRENYVFNEKEDLPSLFTNIINLVNHIKHIKNKSLNLDGKKLENLTTFNIILSDFITIKLMFVDNKFIDFFSIEALSKIGGHMPKYRTKNIHAESFPYNWKDAYWKVSIYSGETIKEMKKSVNFNLDTLKLSYTEEYHDINFETTINVILDFVNYFDESSDKRYLEIALDLVQRYLEKFPEDDLAKIDLYIIRLKQFNKLSEEDEFAICDISERAEKLNDKYLRFACEVLLRNKIKAQRLFNSHDEKGQNMIKIFPIYRLYENLE